LNPRISKIRLSIYDFCRKEKDIKSMNYITRVKNMLCPICQMNFHPQMNNVFIGKNGRNNGVFLYYQICPECKEPIIGIKESLKGEVYLNPNEVEGLVILTKERRR